jgi:hypothetical protein
MLREIVFSLLLSAVAATTVGDTSEIPYRDFLSQNNANIGRLALGMTKDQVITLMKSYTTAVRSGPLNNPYKTESFQRDSDNYEVLYYLTRKHPPFRSIADSQATPVVLKNGAVVGWGQSALTGLRPQGWR